MTEIESLRQQINSIDKELLALFVQRMDTSVKIADYKAAKGLPTLDEARQQQILDRVATEVPQELSDYARVLYTTLFDLSRSLQNSRRNMNTPMGEQLRQLTARPLGEFPQSATVACQGIAGAYSQQAASKLFAGPNILYFKSFEGVFAAVEQGLCRYGVLPLENSTAGSVNAVYDLLHSRCCHIVRSARLPIEHALLVPRGTRLEDITEIFSHEQALRQCESFIKSLADVKTTVCENTASAARMVAESGRTDAAAIASPCCGELYGLTVLGKKIQDTTNNATRFVCISRQPELWPGADRVSLMMTLPHRSGSLYGVLSRFAALGLNLTKLESRPIPQRDFEFLFYFDLAARPDDPRLKSLLEQLSADLPEVTFLGGYTEV